MTNRATVFTRAYKKYSELSEGQKISMPLTSWNQIGEIFIDFKYGGMERSQYTSFEQVADWFKDNNFDVTKVGSGYRIKLVDLK